MTVKQELLSIFDRLNVLMGPINRGDIVFMMKTPGIMPPMTPLEFAALYNDFMAMKKKVEAI